MSDSNPTAPRSPAPNFRNWLSLAGAVLAVGSLFAFVFLVAIDTFSREGNPYLGILTYIVSPAFLIAGLTLVALGWWLRRRQLAAHPEGGEKRSLAIDLAQPRHRRFLVIFGSLSVVFLMLTAFGSYQTYRITESEAFCGKTCHTVMEPEFTRYHHGSHARVSCAECHIGSGASWYVKSKISGAYQVYSVLFKKYSTPIPTPIANLRPAQETCERCHWPEKFTGNLDRSYEHFLSDKKNTPYTVRLSLRVGGGQPGQGPFGGIHWHMNVANKVEYYASDPQRQTIPWVRMTSTSNGEVRVFRTKEFQGEPPADQIRVMDCMDCHNRPAHAYETANESVETAMALGKISTKLPKVKLVAVDALTQKYASVNEALEKIAAAMRAKYPDATDVGPSIATVQRIYQENFFPQMKADWRSYPSNIGHKDWPGCFRCHDNKHLTVDGHEKIKSSDCNACHSILAQGSGEELLKLAPQGAAFKHPGGEFDSDLLCSDCHNGAIQGK
ncbi:MAG: NapC/NirT family cytochrome c [Opitutae bacterium]|nr:NapC/NirT family cytochrome c [Opitutae bacterium]